MAGSDWNPWATLRAREATTLVWQRVPGGGRVEVTADGQETVVLDPRLGRRERRAVLAHELIHLEREVLPAGTTSAVRDREEFQVRAETVRRLVPPLQLQRFVDETAVVEPVTAQTVAERFDVPTPIALAALLQLRANAC